jgi:hypothetical protein
MKKIHQFRFSRRPFAFVISFILLLQSWSSVAQTEQVFCRVVLQKVGQGKEAEFEKLLRDIMKPIHQLRKQSGKITGWYFYKVHFTGMNDDYNYVSVFYHNSWEKTEANDKWAELLKQSSPKTDPEIFKAKLNALRQIVGESLYIRSAMAAPQGPVAAKFVRLDFMKVKPGMYDAYMKVEREDWKPVHKALADAGAAGGWRLWERLFPAGTTSSHDFATSTIYTSYKQMAEINFFEAFKKVYPENDIQQYMERTEKSRDLVRTELWELIDMIQ